MTDTPREKPIRFTTPMVKALLSGRKTQTRELVKPQPVVVGNEIRFPWATFFANGHVHTWDRNGVGGQNWNASEYPKEDKFSAALKRTPYTNACPYEPGMTLWVREMWATDPCYDQIKPSELKPHSPIRYGSEIVRGYHKVRSSIHMPRVASRINLHVTEVRCQRLHEINPDDLTAEGFPSDDSPPHDGTRLTFHGRKLCFAELWDQLNGYDGPGSWESNPYVWAVSFNVEVRQ